MCAEEEQQQQTVARIDGRKEKELVLCCQSQFEKTLTKTFQWHVGAGWGRYHWLYHCAHSFPGQEAKVHRGWEKN